MILSGSLAYDLAAHDAATPRLAARLAELDERRHAAERTVDALLASWRGDAATHFATRWREWDDAAAEVVDSLSALLGAIDLARRDVETAESHGADRATDLGGRLG
ncbi:WXG100 family type VII secretion target [Nocardioides sp. zg-1308]|uniref:WXG100 family type VII secretion target n=1 Tax=Nocardioides renjunii TaxID=3095075 RepID=A0ABU5K727_9ACTN|nr:MULTISPECIES: WXG100 family type VII secretion target [unclassified Nocardioides]MDZ5660638.1 WXG100 family type VII secretion target [Nocardioides sp. S-58]NPD03755.1 WXG100 family type VII secretion target [Nocardioides sp. zg-1308]WQQ21635.1 WXG100 family type VII secretion target [Nocardioides sp. S-34]